MSQEKKFGILFICIFTIFCIYCFLQSKLYFFYLFTSLSIITFVITFFFTNYLIFPLKFWMLIAHTLSLIVRPILFTAIYLLIFLPIGFIRNQLKYSPIILKQDKNKDTYWKMRDRVKISIFKQF